MNLLEKIRQKVKEDFEGIYHRDGVTPYFSHLEAVEEIAQNLWITENGSLDKRQEIIFRIINLAHDSLEDIPKYKENPEQLFVDLEVLDSKKYLSKRNWSVIHTALTALNKNNYSDYFEYIKGVSESNYYAIHTKIADLKHNLQTSTGNQKVKYLLSQEVLRLNLHIDEIF